MGLDLRLGKRLNGHLLLSFSNSELSAPHLLPYLPLQAEGQVLGYLFLLPAPSGAHFDVYFHPTSSVGHVGEDDAHQ